MTQLTISTSTTPETTKAPASLPVARFDWQGTPLRSFRDAKGAIWFVAKDVCQALDLTNTSRGIDRLKDHMKGVTTVNTLGGPQEVITISEPGVYALAFRSRKPEAEAFQQWVFETVLPTIRQDGMYIMGEERLLSAATVEELQAQLDHLKAKAAQALEAKEVRGLNGAEEREARSIALKGLNSGRRSRKRSPRSTQRKRAGR